MFKITFLHGLGMAIAGAVLNLALYLAGLQDDPANMTANQLIGLVVGLVITVVGLRLAMKARREQQSAEDGFGYGAALGTGTLTAVWSSLLGAGFHVLYLTVINPGFVDALVDGQLAKLEAQGMSGAQLDQAEGMVRLFSGVPMQAIFAVVFGLFFGFIVSLIVAAFMKRPATESFDDAAGDPPPLINA